MPRRFYYVTGAGAAILLIIFMIYATKKLSSKLREADQAWQYDHPPTYVLTPEDSAIIGKKYISRISVEQIRHLAGRRPVSSLEFDSTCSLLVLKVNANSKIPLKKMLHFAMVPYIDESFSVPYENIGVGGFELLLKDSLFKEDASRVIDTMRLSVIGDHMKMIAENDSIISYSMQCKSFAIRYPPRRPFDILCHPNREITEQDEIAADILLYKRGGVLYFLFATPERSKFSMPPNLLFNIVTNQ